MLFRILRAFIPSCLKGSEDPDWWTEAERIAKEVKERQIEIESWKADLWGEDEWGEGIHANKFKPIINPPHRLTWRRIIE